MNDLSGLFAATVALAGLLTLISIWTPRRLAVKGTALASGVLLLPLAYASLVDLLSRPKPIDLEWWQAHAQEATVLGSQMQEGQGIYVWLQLPDVREPRGYVLPWNRTTAEQLQQAQRQAEQQPGGGGSVRMRLPFEPSLDDREPMFYAQPQPAPPPKDMTSPPPKYYQPPGRDA
jgi:hypothetical protein